LFNTNHTPNIGEVEILREGLRVVTAPNASPMTFTGTRSYILGEGEVAIIDPGPDDEKHFEALTKALFGQRVSHILVTHSHIDHSPLAHRLSQTFDAPIFAFGASGAGMSEPMRLLAGQGGLAGGEGIDTNFKPDVLLQDSEEIRGVGWKMEAIHTPGHMSNHLCFAWEDSIFSGDHIMAWSTTLVSPPDGDLTQFMISLEKLQGRSESIYYPGHGAPLINAQKMLSHQFTHRKTREAQILEEMNAGTVHQITSRIYTDLDHRLLPMAARNVFAHMIDLHQRGIVRSQGALAFDARFSLTKD